MLQILVRPLGADRFSAEVNGKVLVKSSRIPFLDCARVLMASGVAKDEFLVMVRVDGRESLKSTVGEAARLTVWEGNQPPVFAEWRPMDKRG